MSGGAQCVAQTLVNKFGEKKAGYSSWDYRTGSWNNCIFEVRCCYPDSTRIWTCKENKEIHVVLCDSAPCRSGYRICIYPAISRISTGCKYAECGSGNYDRSWCSGRYLITDFCRNPVVKIYWQQNQCRTSD